MRKSLGERGTQQIRRHKEKQGYTRQSGRQDHKQQQNADRSTDEKEAEA